MNGSGENELRPTRRPRGAPSNVRVAKSLWGLDLSKDQANPESLAVCSEACKDTKVTMRERCEG